MHALRVAMKVCFHLQDDHNDGNENDNKNHNQRDADNQDLLS